MLERTTTVQVIFRRSAMITGLTEPLPAGAYDIETEEELIQGLSFLAYRRLRTTIIVPALVGGARGRQMIEIEAESLAAALAQEAAAA
jgi:hypothetical protein